MRDQGFSAPNTIEPTVSTRQFVAEFNKRGSTEPVILARKSARSAVKLEELGEIGEGIDKTVHVLLEVDVTTEEAVIKTSK